VRKLGFQIEGKHLRSGKVVDEDSGTFGECKKSVFVKGNVAVVGASG